jgi:spore coat protein SA
VAPELLPVPPTRGGAIERWIRDATIKLAGRGHVVDVIARDHGDGLTERVIDGVRYHFVRIPPAIDSGRLAGLFKGLWYYAAARRIIARLNPDIVHHHSRPAGLWLTMRSGAAPRHVISLHSMDYGWGFGHRAWDRGLFRHGLARAARILCVSKFIHRHTVERYPSIAGHATTVYNGVDGAQFRPNPKAAGKSERLVVYVGRVEERKGVAVLVDAFEQFVSAAAPDVKLVIVGPHSYWDAKPSGYYRTLADRCAANPRIEFRGPTYSDDELAAVYRSATVSVVPSVFPEALGLVSLEAQASGTPVVVSDAGGLPESVAPGESGIVVEQRNAEQLGNAIAALLTDEPKRSAMAAAARPWVMSTFSWDVIAAQLEGVYRDVLLPPAGSRG